MTSATAKSPIRKPLKSSEPVVLSRIASIPPKEVADEYVGRKFGEKTDFDIFQAALERRWNVLLEGDTGTGKTMASRAFAALNGMHFYSTPNNGAIDPSQLFGKMLPNEHGDWEWIDGGVTDVVRHGGLLLLNEVNFLPPRISTAIFGLLDGRRELTLLDHKGEVIQAHDDLLIVADMNPDYLGTNQLNAAFRNRFEIQLDWGYDTKVEASLIRSKTLRDFAINMRKARRDGNIQTPTSTNMMAEFEKMVEVFGLDFALQNFVQHYDTDDRKSVSEALRNVRTGLESDYRPKAEPKHATPKKSEETGWAISGDDEDEIEKWFNN